MATTLANNLEPNSRSSNPPSSPPSVAHRSFKHIQHTQYQIPQINYPKRDSFPPNTSLLTQSPPANPQTFPNYRPFPQYSHFCDNHVKNHFANSCPPIKNEFDGRAFATLSRFLKQCINRLKRDDLLNDILNNSSAINVIVIKLPETTRWTWWRRKGKIIKRERLVRLKHLSDFLAQETEELDHVGYELLFSELDNTKSMKDKMK